MAEEAPLRPVTRMSGLAVLCCALTAPAVAAQADGSAWKSTLGCWRYNAAAEQIATVLCVLPIEGDPLAADLVTFTDGTETQRTRVVADGTRQEFTSPNCAGSESAWFSGDGRRVYFRSTHRCGDAGTDAAHRAMLTVTGGGTLLHVFGTNPAEGADADFRTLRPAAEREIPFPVRRVVRPFHTTTQYALRSEAAAVPLLAATILEALESVNAAAAEIWMVATVQGAGLTAAWRRELALLESAQAPTSILEMYRALSTPGERIVATASTGTRLEVTVMSADYEQALNIVQSYRLPSLVDRTGARVSWSGGCSGLEALGAVGGGAFGVPLVVPATSRVIAFMSQCPGIAANMSLASMQAIYGAYAGVTDNLGGAPPRDRSLDPGRHPTPDPIPVGGLNPPTRNTGSRVVRTTGQQGNVGARSHPAPSNSHPAPAAIPIGRPSGGSPTVRPTPPAPTRNP